MSETVVVKHDGDVTVEPGCGWLIFAMIFSWLLWLAAKDVAVFYLRHHETIQKTGEVIMRAAQ